MEAALELFEERGFEATTVADIGARAGVTERTFFRHFTDKREVLFDGSQAFEATVVAGILAASPTATAADATEAGIAASGTWFDSRRAWARRRSAVIGSNPGLEERELLKMARLADAAGGALRERGHAEATALLASQIGVAAFRLAFTRWLVDERPEATFAEHVHAAFAELRTAVV